MLDSRQKTGVKEQAGHQKSTDLHYQKARHIKATAITQVLQQHSNRQRDQGTEQSPETDLGVYEDLVYDEDGISRQGEKNELFNKWYLINQLSILGKKKYDPYLTAYTKINSRWIKI